MKKGYWVTTYRSISDEKALMDYAKLAGPAISSGGGKFLVRASEGITAYEAGVAQRVVVIEFESLEKAKATYNGPAYQHAKQVLGNAVVRDVRLVEGAE
jgi:uncharacterized protein (DUF1330 family)